MSSAAKRLRPTLLRAGSPLADGAAQRRLLDATPLEEEFEQRLAAHGLAPLAAKGVEVLQLNLGKRCNQTCAHCHVDAGPERSEVMDRATADVALRVLAASDVHTVDLTGGAPELCPSFRHLVEGARALGRHVMDRCNLTILSARGFEDLPEFLAANGVEVVCSLPSVRAWGTDRQRGDGVFDASIEGLRRLNAVGYGRDEDKRLVLVANPVGAFLPPDQAALEAEWKRELRARFDVSFDALHTLTNMPISRYLEWLETSGNTAEYLCTLTSAFNPAAVDGLMCRTTLSVSWDGRLFDCDFNQMLDLEVEGVPARLEELDPAVHGARRIVTGRHCYGCTAGAGSSCGGALT